MIPYSRDAYRGLVRDALDEGYRFASFLDEGSADEKLLYLRHDVDFSLEMAVELGRINAELDVSATFFVLLRGHAYNPASRRSQERLAELTKLGQQLAFHWAAPPELPSDEEALADHVRAEFGLARALVAKLQPLFAVHTPDATLLRRTLELDAPPLVNVTGARFMRGLSYYADSNLRYTVATWRRLVRRGEPRLHVLLHPVNWIAGGADMSEVLRHAWPYLLREAEQELRLNRVWTATFPDGMPQTIADSVGAALADAQGGR